METLDLLIAKFKEVKEALTKALPSVLHSTVEGFMGGLKLHPKGSAERGKFITSHMSHPAFVGALNAHPQGKQLHGMLMNHLDSRANAGPKAYGGNASVKVQKSIDDDFDDFLSKALPPVAPRSSMVSQMKGAGNAALTSPKDMGRANELQGAMSGAYQPKPPAIAPLAPAKKLTGLDRIKAMSQQPIKKDEGVIHGKISGKPIIEPTPKLRPSHGHIKNEHRAYGYGAAGVDTTQVDSNPEPTKSLRGPGTASAPLNNLKFKKTINTSSAPSTNMAMSCTEKLSLNKGGQWSLNKSECSKCHADPCECQTTGILVDKAEYNKRN